MLGERFQRALYGNMNRPKQLVRSVVLGRRILLAAVSNSARTPSRRPETADQPGSMPMKFICMDRIAVAIRVASASRARRPLCSGRRGLGAPFSQSRAFSSLIVHLNGGKVRCEPLSWELPTRLRVRHWDNKFLSTGISRTRTTPRALLRAVVHLPPFFPINPYLFPHFSPSLFKYSFFFLFLLSPPTKIRLSSRTITALARMSASINRFSTRRKHRTQRTSHLQHGFSQARPAAPRHHRRPEPSV